MNTIIVVWTVILCISGQVTYSIMESYNGDVPWARKEKVTDWSKFHKWCGWIMLFFGNLTCGVGTWNYIRHFVWGEYRTLALWTVGPSITLGFCFVVLLFEIWYRNKERKSRMVLKNPAVTEKGIRTFTFHEIDEYVEKGEKLLLFDNLVLDLDGYERIHPGGKFVLNRNVGRDISKFFYGGYAMVNYPGVKPFSHPLAALEIAESLIAGVMEGQERV